MDLVEYNCAKQFMMASNARLFGGDTALSAILASNDPREQKRLGRQVRHFDPALWQDECEAIVLRSNLAKFSQNKEMRVALENKGTRRIAEASPRLDCVRSACCLPYIVVRTQPLRSSPETHTRYAPPEHLWRHRARHPGLKG